MICVGSLPLRSWARTLLSSHKSQEDAMCKVISAAFGCSTVVAVILCFLQVHSLEMAALTIDHYRQLEIRRAEEIVVTREMVKFSQMVDVRCQQRVSAYRSTLQNLLSRLGLDEDEFQSPLSVHLKAVGGGSEPKKGPDLVQDSKVFLIRSKERAHKKLRKCREKLYAHRHTDR